MRIARIAHLPPLTWLASIVAAVVQVMRSGICWTMNFGDEVRADRGNVHCKPDSPGPTETVRFHTGKGGVAMVTANSFETRLSNPVLPMALTTK